MRTPSIPPDANPAGAAAAGEAVEEGAGADRATLPAKAGTVDADVAGAPALVRGLDGIALPLMFPGGQDAVEAQKQELRGREDRAVGEAFPDREAGERCTPSAPGS